MTAEKTYVDLISELRDNVESDIIPEVEKKEIMLHINIVAEMLWKYSG